MKNGLTRPVAALFLIALVAAVCGALPFVGCTSEQAKYRVSDSLGGHRDPCHPAANSDGVRATKQRGNEPRTRSGREGNEVEITESDAQALPPTSQRTVRVAVVSYQTSRPIVGATCSVGESSAVTDESGELTLSISRTETVLKVGADSCYPRDVRLPTGVECITVSLLQLEGKGLVVGADGIPVSRARVEIRVAENDPFNAEIDSDLRHVVAHSDADGCFRFPVRSRRQLAEAVSDGQEPAIGLATIPPGSMTATIELGTCASVRVVTESQTSGTVILRSPSRPRAPAASRELVKGQAEFSGLVPYSRLELTLTCFPMLSIPVAAPGAGETITIPVFPRTGTVELDVVAAAGTVPVFSSPAVSEDGATFTKLGNKVSVSRIALPEHLFPVSPKCWFGLMNDSGHLVATATYEKTTLTSNAEGMIVVQPLVVRTGIVLGPDGLPIKGCEVALRAKKASARPVVRTVSGDDGSFVLSLPEGIPYGATAQTRDLIGNVEAIPGNGEIVITLGSAHTASLVIDDGIQGSEYSVWATPVAVRPRTKNVKGGERFTLCITELFDGVAVTSHRGEFWFPVSAITRDGVIHLPTDATATLKVRVVEGGRTGSGEYVPRQGVIVRAASGSIANSRQTRSVYAAACAETDGAGFALIEGCSGGPLTFSVVTFDGDVLLGSASITADRDGVYLITLSATRVGLVEAWGTCKGIPQASASSISVLQTREKVRDGMSAREIRDAEIPLRFVTDLAQFPGSVRGSFDPDLQYLYVRIGNEYYFAGMLTKTGNEWRANLAR